MRKIFTLSLLLAATVASARQISPDEALSAANAFLNTGSLTPVGAAGAMTRSDAQPYYVFNSTDGNGFVIISGDDRYSKVLGYSDRGTFDVKHMPPQLKAMLDQFAENSAKPSNWNGTHPSWNTTFTTRADEGVLLETAKWGQGAPYNGETPLFGDQHAPTGCVATAMAIVMKYHSWPETYDWDAMPMQIEYDGENPPTANSELARLMKDAGEAVYMSYGPTESGADMNWVGHRLQYTFHYSPDCQFITAANFSNDRWLELLKGNIDAGNPVIYQGTNEKVTQNHAFVLDGYNSIGYHVNWGWDGWYNGYYALESLSPNDSQDFSCNNGMVLNIVPDKTGMIYSECFVDHGYFFGTKVGLSDPLNISVKDVVKGEPFHVVNDLITYPKEFDGLYGIALVSKDNKIKEVLSSSRATPWGFSDPGPFRGFKSDFLKLVVTCDIDPSDRIQLVTKKDGEDEFRLVLGTLEHPSYLSVVNNTPRFVDVKVTVGPGVKFWYFLYEPELILLEEGTHVLKDIPMGIYCEFRVGPEEEKENQDVVVTLKGEYVYGDIQDYVVHKESLGILQTLFSPYDIQAFVREHEDGGTIHLDQAGTLENHFLNKETRSIVSLSLTGKMNAIDFWFIRDNFPLLKSLNIKEVEIEGVEAEDTKMTQFHGHSYNEPNAMPEFALSALESLETIILPESLTKICDNSMTATNLYGITIPKGVTYIGLNALYNNNNLQAVCLLNPEPVAINDCVFANTLCPSNGFLFVPDGSLEKYRESYVWGDFNNITEGVIPASVKFETRIDDILYSGFINTATVMKYEGSAAEVTIPETIQYDDADIIVVGIGDNAFEGCETIESVIIPNTVTDIESFAFSGCRNLKTVKMSENVRKIGPYGFGHCSNLKECELGEKIEVLGYNSFQGTALETVYLSSTAKYDVENATPFCYNSSLKEFIVHPENPYYTAIDGVLYRRADYRIEEPTLALECLPGQIGEIFSLPDSCKVVRNWSVVNDSPKQFFINSDCEYIDAGAIHSNSQIEHIVMPKNAIVQPDAISSCCSLKTMTFTGNLRMKEMMISNCDSLLTLIIDSPDEVVELDRIFANEKETINIFTSSTEKNFIYSDSCVIYVPGQCSEGYKTRAAGEVKEMWRYNINRQEGIFEIVPLVEGLTIDQVTINDKVVVPQGGIYELDDASTQDIKVDFTLLGRQKMSTHYTSEFNATVADSKVSGVGELIGSEETAPDVYTIDGLQIMMNASREDISRLPNGVYILREGNRSRKIVVRN